MFASVAVHMPALLEELPRGSSDVGLGAFLGNAFGSPLNERFWKDNTPFVFARTANLQGLKIYLIVVTWTITALTPARASWINS